MQTIIGLGPDSTVASFRRYSTFKASFYYIQ